MNITYKQIMDNHYSINALDEVRDDLSNQIDKLICYMDNSPDMNMLQKHSIEIALQAYDAVLERIDAQYELVAKKQSTLIQTELN